MKVVKISSQIMHKSRFTEDVFQGNLSFEEVMEMITIEEARQKPRK
jgi:hypothetical protein